ncbi:MAG: hypothetical protein WD467_03015 [Candidatus Saccharimonadales bacterium]
MRQPFTATVGVENRGQYLEIAHADVDRRLGEIAVGILMSEKTGLENISNRHGLTYPLFDEVDEIVAAQHEYGVPAVPLIIHYNTDRPDQAGQQLVAALHRHETIAAVQVNGLQPEHYGNLEFLKAARPKLDVIVQIDNYMLRKYRHQPDRFYAAGPELLVEEVTKHGVIDGVWLDGSGGCGKELDVDVLIPYIDAFARKGISVGVAGGLHAGSVHDLLLPLLRRYASLDNTQPASISWDAQSGVMDETRSGHRFNTQKAVDFLCSSNALRREVDSLIQ